ncbi:hypothetical protein JCM14469_26320 [Desulfatiferula olefinivorans]
MMIRLGLKQVACCAMFLLCLLLSAGSGRAESADSDADPLRCEDGIVPDLPADDLLPLSIEQAVTSALEHNRDLRVQRLEPIRIDTFARIEQAAFDPELFAELAWTRDEDRLNPVLARETQGEARLGMRKAFDTGTRLELSLSRQHIRETDEPKRRESSVGMSLTQSLLKGFGPSVNRVRIRQAALDTTISREELKAFTERLVADTELAYWNLVLAEETIIIVEQSLAVARKQRSEIEEQIAIGHLPRTEAAAARSEEALRKQDLIDARSRVERYRLILLNLIDPERDEARVRALTPPSIDTLPITDASERLALAEALRADLAESRLRLERHDLETVMTRNGLLPKLDFFVSLGRTVDGNRLDNVFESENRADDIAVGLSFSHTLGNRSARAREEAARTSRLQARLAVDNLISLIRLDVKLAINEVERLRKQITATRTTCLFQEQTCVAEKDRFDVGAGTSLMVAQAQRDLLSARLAEVEALVTYRMALIRLFLAEGSLLAMRGIDLD